MGIGFVSCGRLHRAFLTGLFDANTRFEAPDRRASVPSFTPDALKANVAMLASVQAWAKRKNVTPAQFSLGWLQAQKHRIVPIPGTTNPHPLAENLGAEAVTLTPNELRDMRTAIAGVPLQGVRTPESAQKDQ